MYYDFFPGLTDLLSSAMFWLTNLGILLAVVSAILAGILFLPIFGFNEQQVAVGTRALRWTAVGAIVILVGPRLIEVIEHFFPASTALPVLPYQLTPTPTP